MPAVPSSNTKEDQPMVMVEGVSFRYPRTERPAVRQVTIDIRPEPTLILGVNGAGKSTLLRLMAGHLEPDQGTLTRTARHSMVPQSPVVIRRFSAADQVAYAGWLKGMKQGAAEAAAGDALGRVGLTPLAGRKVATLSGGELARVGIACGLVGDVNLLLLDEPSASLDPIARRSVHEVLEKVAKQDVGIVASSHSAADLGDPFERIVVLDGGVIVHDGSRNRFLIDQHHHPVVQELALALKPRG